MNLVAITIIILQKVIGFAGFGWQSLGRLDPVWFNSLPKDKILDETKLKAFADDKINVAPMTISVFDRVENIAVKENAG